MMLLVVALQCIQSFVFRSRPAKQVKRYGFAFICINILLFGSLAAQTASQPVSPHYEFDIRYDHEKKRISGKMLVRFNKQHYPSDELLFALPPNRFKSLDVRGMRRHRIVPVFSLSRFQDNLEDPKFPDGFNPGRLEIQSIHEISANSPSGKRKLDHLLEPNEDLEVGYSIIDGLLRVFLPETADSAAESNVGLIEIHFITQLPQHTQEGGINGTLLTAQWHPVLLALKEQKNQSENQMPEWETSGDIPTPASYQVTWKSQLAGTLITTPATHLLSEGQSVTMTSSGQLLKYFPLIFLLHHQRYDGFPGLDLLLSESETSNPKKPKPLISYYKKGHERRAELFHNWTTQYLRFMITRYGLKVPWKTVKIVAVEAEYEQIDVWNNIVLVPLPNYKRSELLDRQAMGFLTRRLGQLWFGEKVWNDQDQQLWLNTGIPAFLGLKFYQRKYGPEAGIFDRVDWLNPHYRDHYYEEMVLNIAPNLRYPIISSFRKNLDSNKYMRIVSYKSAMVLSMLEYLMGPQAFKKGLQHFVAHQSGKVADHKDFQKSMELFHAPQKRRPLLPDHTPYNSDGAGSLEWFFSQWFRTAQRLDYSLKDHNTEQIADDLFQTEVIIQKNQAARMPVEVALRTRDGREVRKIAPGVSNEEKLIFQTSSPADEISLDPDEKLLETSRTNNHSFTFYRVRFAFDWKKQREHLVLLVPGITSNAIDGNSFGVGIRSKVDDYFLYAIPGYGTKNNRALYKIRLHRKDVFTHGLTLGGSIGESAGIKSQGLSLEYIPSTEPGEVQQSLFSSFSRQKMIVESTSSPADTAKEPSSTGETNAFFLQYGLNFEAAETYIINWNIWNEQPFPEMKSDFSYSLWHSSFGQTLHVGHRKWFTLALQHGKTYGETPLQKKFQLGSPKVLRGYPQNTDLSDDHLLASRLDFYYPLVAAPLWGDISAMNIQGTVFYDTGKIWSLDSSFEQEKLRKNAGFGIEWTVDTVSLFQVPLKLEVAFPIDDPDYDKPRFIILGTLTGS